MLSKISMAQDHSIRGKHYISNSLISPAYTGDCRGIDAVIFHRNQWVGLQDAPYLSGAAVDVGFKNNYGLGLYIVKDKNGYNYKHSVQLSFGYHINLAPSYSMDKSVLSFGMAYVGNQYILDESEFNKVSDPIISGGKINSFSSNFNYGVKYTFNDFKVGVSLLSIMEEKVGLYKSSAEKPLPKYYVVETSNIFKIKYYRLKPFIAFTHNSKNEMFLDAGFKLTSSPYEKDLFDIMIMHKSEYSNNKYNHRAIVGLFEYKFKNYGIGYAYEHGFSKLHSLSFKTHEIVLRYRFMKVDKCNCEN